MILGFSAKKQGGKTTAVKGIISKSDLECWDYVTINFADMLKKVVGHTLLPAEMITVGTNVYSVIEGNKDLMLPCGLTVRQALQTVGTDWFRKLWPDVWINAWKMQVQAEDSKTLILVGDVRFPNELKAIQDRGGHVIRLLRAPFSEDTHESETALDIVQRESFYPNEPSSVGLMFDAMLDNTNMSIEQQNDAVWDMVQKAGWLAKNS